MGKTIEDTLPDFFSDTWDGYTGTFITEVGLPGEIAEGKQRSCISPGKPLNLAQVG